MFMLTHISKFPSPSFHIILATGLKFAPEVHGCFVKAEM